MESKLESCYSAPIPIDEAWKLAKKTSCSDLIARVLPSHFANVDILEGGDGAGSVRVVTMGQALGSEGVGTKVKERVDVVDESTHTIGISFIEGSDPRYRNARFSLKLTPGPGDTTKIVWSVAFTPPDASVPPPVHLKVMADETMKAMLAYAKEHASEFQ